MNQKLNNKGVVLILALIFISVLAVISTAVMIYMYNQSSANYREYRRLKALYACEAALNYAYQSLAQGETLTPAFQYSVIDTSGDPVANVTIETVSNPGTITCSSSY